ncbi:MAG: hypothetical protein WA057_02970 [Candidatus Magasanikiibacteriota bacterium]
MGEIITIVLPLIIYISTGILLRKKDKKYCKYIPLVSFVITFITGLFFISGAGAMFGKLPIVLLFCIVHFIIASLWSRKLYHSEEYNEQI